MNRFQKKCFIGSAGVHLLLVVILFVGPAFLSAPNKADNLQELNFVPTKLVDALVSGGGTPKPAPSAPAPPTPVPAAAQPAPTPVTPEKVKEPEPPREVVKPAKQTRPEPESLEITKKPKLAPESLKLVTRKPDSKTQKKSSTADSQEKQMADARRRTGELINQTARSMKNGLSSATKIEDTDAGPGGGGPSYANYRDWIYTVYLNAWVAPDDATSESAVVEATVTITRDGSVSFSRVTSKSGDPQVDASVQRTLNRVITIGRPFPEGATEKQRTYILRFDVKAKRGLA